MKPVKYLQVSGSSPLYFVVFAVLGLITAIGLGAAYYMEHNGHVVTGMSNQVVWGMPHVFAVFLIVAASGALNVASMASVFGKTSYKPLAPLSGLLALALLSGGLMILVLDLGRPDRLIVAMTYYNFKSIFAWNMILYNGFFIIVAAYLWTMMDRQFNKYSKPVGLAAFLWRLTLTTGTGSIFGFLVAREAYDAAIMAPMFIVMSFSFGLAIFTMVMILAYRFSGRPLGDYMTSRLIKLQGTFIAGVLLLVLAYHLTNLYATQHHGVEAFILRDGGVYTLLFWIGFVLVGSLVPLLIFFHPALKKSLGLVTIGLGLVVIGGLALMYVIIIGGQAYPMEMFPGYEVSSSFFDGVIAQYKPTLAEILLGIGGIALAGVITTFAVKVLRFMPASLADTDVDPHHKS